MDAMVLKGIVTRIPRLVARIASTHVLRLCIVALVLALGANVASAQVTLSMPDTLINPSTSVSVPIRVTGFNHVGSFSLTITFDKTVLTYTGLANTPSFGSFFPPSVATANANGSITIAWFSVSPALNIGTGTLLNLLFTIGTGSSTVAFTNTIPSALTDSLGTNLPATYTNGRVRTPGANLPPNPPTLSYPSNGASNLATSFTLNWNASSGATNYRVQLSTDSGFGTTLVDDSTLSSTSRLISSLSNNQTYYWRVSAKNSAGSSSFSSAWSFITAPLPPAAPTLLTPADAAPGQSLTPTLTWNPSSGATTYRLQVSTTSNFASTIIDMAGISTTSQIVTSLSGSSTYYWRVSASNGGGESVFSSGRSFTTMAGPPSIPGLSSPSNGATGQPTSLTLVWSSSSGATTYTLQVSTASDFSTTIVNDATLTGTSRLVSGLLNNTLYYWRVSATGPNGTSSYSTAWTFTTLPAAPSAPTLNSPSDGAVGTDVNLTLTWNASSGATTYRVQVSTASDFSSTVVNDSTMTSLSKAVSGLSTSTLYYWHVNAKNAGGTSAYSASRTFTTGAGLLPPALTFPFDLTVGVSPTAATIAWALSAGATSYRVQIATDNAFSNIVFDTASVTVRSILVTSLSYNTTYYWHVSSTAGTNTSSYSAPWSFSTLAGPPSAPVLSSPPNGSVGIPTTNLSLTWNATPGATTYRVQLSTASDFSTTIVNDSTVTTTSKSVTGLTTSTTYYWRVSATNTNGTSAYSATWSFTAGGAAPAAPTLISPANNATNQSTSTTFSWSSSLGATSYHLQVAFDQNFTLMAYDLNNLTSTSQGVIGLSGGSQYYWRVSASNTGGSSLYSVAWSFGTGTTATSLSIPDTVAIPGTSLSLPINVTGFYHIGSFSLTIAFDKTAFTYTGLANVPSFGIFSPPSVSAANTSGTITLSWFNVSPGLNIGAGALMNLLFTYNGGTGTVGFINKTPSSITDSLATNMTASYTDGRVRDARNVTPSAPALLTPANAATNQTKNLTLTWSSSVGAVSYHLQVSTVATFASTVYDQSGLTGTSQTMSGLSNGITYYWQVNATNTAGTSAYAAYRSFTTIIAAPAAPTLATPANGATGIQINPTLTWNGSTSAATYRLQVATDSDFVSVVLDDATLTATQRAIGPLISNTKYYWHVSASNVGGASAYSATWNFTAVIPPPAAPTLATPANGATAVTINPTLTWNASTGATTYKLQLATDSLFTSIVVTDSTLTATQRLVGPLTNNIKYFWRVTAANAGGWGQYSTVWNFTTIALIPTAPSLVSPANRVTGLALSPTLTWTTSAGSTTYKLQIATDSLFASVVLVDSTLTTTQRQIGPLPNGAKYFWRVNAKSSGGTSPYSSVWNFTTIVAAPTTPTLFSPVDGARNVPITPALAWNGPTGTVFYRVQVATNASFSAIVFDDSAVTLPTRSVGPLAYNTLYYWRVRAKNDGGTTAYSDPWSFLTTVAPASIPTLVTPVDSEINVSLGPTLRWNASDNATSYHLQVSLSSAFAANIVDDTTLTGTQSSIGPLTLATRYYWRVRAKNASGYSAFSVTRTFRTILTTGVEQVDGAVPKEYALTQNYPNPFNPSTTIQYDIPTSGPVSLKLYSILGEQIFVLVDQHQSPGTYRVRVSASSLPSGIYLYQLRVGSFVQTKRMILLK